MHIVVVDDDKLVCQALKTIIETNEGFVVDGLGYDGVDAIKLYDEFKPDILLMDIRMKTMTGLEAGNEILNKNPEARILYLTTFADNEYIIEAIRIGAKGYLLKQNFDIIIPAFNAVMIGQRVFGDEIISKIPDLMNSPKKNLTEEFDLTDKEVEIISLVADGLSNKEIASSKFLSEGTVRNYISVILEKLDLRDRTQLAIFYYKNM